MEEEGGGERGGSSWGKEWRVEVAAHGRKRVGEREVAPNAGEGVGVEVAVHGWGVADGREH